jgi:hypothetical protein
MSINTPSGLLNINHPPNGDQHVQYEKSKNSQEC